MADNFLHHHPEFRQLIEITAEKKNIQEPSLVEKDYWIMQCLFGLKEMGVRFELKGGSSLSKGFGVINRFSEDIDIRIEPDESLLGFRVYSGKNHDKDQHRESRKCFFDKLSEALRGKISGIVAVERDEEFDSPPKYWNGGIRLKYEPAFPSVPGLKDGILLELGFDRTAPNVPVDMTSWAYEVAIASNVSVKDNRAKQIPCYDLRYTFVEKLQTIVRKYRQYTQTGKLPVNFLRHYYDVYHLIARPDVQEFIGTEAYETHKRERFGSDDTKVSNSGAFKLDSKADLQSFERQYEKTKALYYSDQPDLAEILKRVAPFLPNL